MKAAKKLSLLLVLVLCISLFSGCTREEVALFDAMLKSQEILSMENNTALTFSLSSTGLSNEEQVAFNSAAIIINDLQVNYNQKFQADKERTMTKAQIDSTIKLQNMSFDSSIWVDLDRSNEDFTFKEIIKLPAMLSMFLPTPLNEKEYIVIDFTTMYGTQENTGIPMDYSATMTIALEYQEKFLNAFNKYIKNFNSKLMSVTKLQDKVIDEQTCEIYQIQMNDASFKQFLQHSIINLLKDEELLVLYKDYMTEILSASGQSMPEEMDFTKNIPELLVKANKFFKALNEVTLLGENGIVIEYGINQDGFIISEVGKMDFIINVEELATLFRELSGQQEILPIESTAIFNFVLSYDSKTTKINEDIKVSMPVLTEENSVDFMSMLTSMIPAAPTPSVMVFVDDMYLYLADEPQFINGRTFAPVNDISNALGAEVVWNESTKEATVSKGDTVLIFKVDSDIAMKNGEAVTLDAKVIVVNGSVFIPLRFLSESFGYQINWSPENNVIDIR